MLMVHTFVVFVFIWINFVNGGVPVHPLRTGYNEAEAMALLNIAAGAYAKSPEGCIKETFLGTHPRVLYHMTNQICDEFTNQCGAYILADDANRHLYIVFRGTKTKAQLLTEGWHSLQPSINFYDAGKANSYFFKALNTMWASVEQALTDQRDYRVTFTGHSLGGALASLAALKTAIFGLRNGNQIRLITFGQPRVGNVALAMKHNELVPYSYRVVHGVDIVPHLPGCAKNEIMGASSHPCDPQNIERPYHHGVEIYYPHEMRTDSPYIECLNAPPGEDFNCSDALTFKPENYFQYTYAHRHYFEHKVTSRGKLGCSATQRGEENLDSDAEGPPGTETPHKHNPWQSALTKLRSVSAFLG